MRTQDSPEARTSTPAPSRRPPSRVRGGFVVIGRTDGTHRLTIKNKRPYEHGSMEDAQAEAQRLATRHGREFAVFQEVHAALPAQLEDDAGLDEPSGAAIDEALS